MRFLIKRDSKLPVPSPQTGFFIDAAPCGDFIAANFICLSGRKRGSQSFYFMRAGFCRALPKLRHLRRFHALSRFRKGLAKQAENMYNCIQFICGL